MQTVYYYQRSLGKLMENSQEGIENESIPKYLETGTKSLWIPLF